jgi:hypothetical protein
MDARNDKEAKIIETLLDIICGIKSGKVLVSSVDCGIRSSNEIIYRVSYGFDRPTCVTKTLSITYEETFDQ